MAVKITGVGKGSYAEMLGIEKGDILVSINGHEIRDILDFRFYETNAHLELKIRDDKGTEAVLKLRKGQYDSIGLEFDSYLMDRERSCKNKCIFCFIDQLPKGMRETLYFKDDDSRLSFLFGNYITLTNIDESEIDRIIEMHISPINISVHTMNPELRCKMMNNRFAGESLRFIEKLAKAGIKLNCQLVLCPGINDGEELRYSLSELSKLGESIQSVACVPVGLTGYREGLYPLEAYTKEKAGEVIDIITEFGDIMKEKREERVFYPSDEFYIIAGRDLPDYFFYEDFPQIENGVGLIRNLEDEVEFGLEEYSQEELSVRREVSMIVGTSVYPFMEAIVDRVREKAPYLKVNVIPVKNEFFGGKIDVTGLITGGDILRALKDRNVGEELLIPSVMLKADEDIFLDDITLEELSDQLGLKAVKSGSTGDDLIRSLLGLSGDRKNTNSYYQQLPF